MLSAVSLAIAGSVSCFAQMTATVTALNYAGFAGSFPVAPGSIASAYGNFGSVPTTVLQSLNPMPKELAGVASSENSPFRQGIIQNQDFAINGPAAPARNGEVIQIYATGCGAVEPAVPDGMPPAVLSGAVAEVKVFISVEEAQVQFAGAHPLFPGICQVNAFVPDRSFITGQTPVFITVIGVASNSVSVWVQ